MALVQYTESILETDFNLLFAAQRVEWDPPDATFAASAPGFIAMKAGAKFARLRVRLERWDERPPPPGDEWEDIDELPWASIPGGGPVVVNGFDPPEDGDGLVVEDLARGRVEVLATGRHRYGDDEAPDHLPREDWLLRWWPDAERSDAMAGPCRRLAGAPLFWVPGTAWQAAVHAWAQTGWTVKLLHVHAFAALELALRRLGRPCTAEELVAEAGPWGASRTEDGPYTPASLVLGPPSRWEQQPDFVRRRPVELLARVAAAADMAVIETYGDVVLALRRLGLLVVVDGNGPERFVPNPAPPPVWDVLDLTEGERHALVTAALRSDWQAYGADVQHLLRWAPDGRLRTTTLAMALRLGLPVHVVWGVLRLLEHDGEIIVQGTGQPLDRLSPITLQQR